MPSPTDNALYERIKRRVYRKMPQHSAYRSGRVVQEYKKAGGRYKGNKASAPLKRWFAEEWKNQRGGTGYQKNGDVYRPTKRVSSKTPVTYKELSKTEIAQARKEKKRTGRVKRFKK